MTLAFNSRSPHVQKGNRWIASLSDGTTVFEDKTPGLESAWSRLNKYVKLHKLDITNLRLEAFGRFVNLLSYRTDDGRVQIDGYWQSSCIGAFFGAYTDEINWRGIGYVKDAQVNIIWINDRGVITHEVRAFVSNDIAAILNHG
jgi:hypothetical protein